MAARLREVASTAFSAADNAGVVIADSLTGIFLYSDGTSWIPFGSGSTLYPIKGTFVVTDGYATPIPSNGNWALQSNTGNATLAGTPTVTPQTGKDGLVVRYYNVANAAQITFQDQGTLVGSGLRLRESVRRMGQYGFIELTWLDALPGWQETNFSAGNLAGWSFLEPIYANDVQISNRLNIPSGLSIHIAVATYPTSLPSWASAFVLSTSTSDCTLTGTPTVTAGTENFQFVRFYNEGTTSVIFQDESILPSSGLLLAGQQVQIGPKGFLELVWDPGTLKWWQTGASGGNLAVVQLGATTVHDTLTSANTFAASGKFTVGVTNVNVTGASQTLPSSTPLIRATCVGSSFTLTSNPMMSAGTVNGQIVYLQNVSASNTLTLTRGQGITLPSATFTLNAGGSITLAWDSGSGIWRAIAALNGAT